MYKRQSHELPDTATAQAHLLTGSNCIHSGNYYGTYGTNATPPGMRDDFLVSVFPNGIMTTIASDSRGPSHDGAVDGDSFGWIVHTAALSLKGTFADATYLSGTYSWVDGPGNFQAVGDASVTSTYKFFGWYTSTPNDPTANTSSWRAYFWMDDSNHVSGGAVDTLTGTVSGNTFTGTVNYFKLDESGLPTDLLLHFPVSGTYSNTASGVTFDGQFTANDSVVTFSTIGCRAN